jgi:hypothetical protein
MMSVNIVLIAASLLPVMPNLPALTAQPKKNVCNVKIPLFSTEGPPPVTPDRHCCSVPALKHIFSLPQSCHQQDIFCIVFNILGKPITPADAGSGL